MCRDAQGQTPAQLCANFKPRAAAKRLCEAMGADLPERQASVHSAAGPALAPVGAAQSAAAAAAAGTSKDGSGGASGGAAGTDLSPAARLQAARTPEEAADVLRGMTADHRALRVRMWAAQTRAELDKLPFLTDVAKERLQHVRAHPRPLCQLCIACVTHSCLPTVAPLKFDPPNY
jgi:hypothetical protein